MTIGLDSFQCLLKHIHSSDEFKVSDKEGCVLIVAKYSKDLVPFMKLFLVKTYSTVKQKDTILKIFCSLSKIYYVCIMI